MSNSQNQLSKPIFPVFLASLLSIHGLRKKSLSPGGAATAFVVGLLMMAGGVKVFGVSLCVFYLTGSRATKCEYLGKKQKSQFEDGYHEAVLSNSFAAFIACVLWNVIFVPGSLQAFLVSLLSLDLSDILADALKLKANEIPVYGDGGSWCPIDQSVANGWSRALILASLGHFACCLGDTLASELGILSRSKPILITTLKPVPPGTNGGVSAFGVFASLAGGAIMGLTAGACLILESSKCRESWMEILLSMIWWGTVGGGTGSLVDSLLGATVQQTKFSENKKLILQDESPLTGPIKVISGINVLTNNQVNVVSSIFTCLWISLL
ncbi:integral membrane protein DUF92-domain-containing protein [Rhodocollybia butyracea]|uniref:Integral membrane protein DUF92-domain-containing protein n=1 Tax=Rhodocollybia butyracea TaxID=206335 RepID=A0A9P5PU59_9AGAR|nr:integral membrane protein DUF92-domain-containing protein [Rhodocollybia butyracea]